MYWLAYSLVVVRVYNSAFLFLVLLPSAFLLWSSKQIRNATADYKGMQIVHDFCSFCSLSKIIQPCCFHGYRQQGHVFSARV